MRLGTVRPSRARNIEVRPLGLSDKFLDKDGSHYGAGLAARADVFYVSDVRLDLLAVIGADGQLPKAFAHVFAAANDVVDQALVVAHDARVDVAEGDDHGTRKCGHIDYACRTVLFCISDGVGE